MPLQNATTGLVLPTHRIHRSFRRKNQHHDVAEEASVFLTAVLESALIEILSSSRRPAKAERDEIIQAFRVKAALGFFLRDEDIPPRNVIIAARHLQEGIRGSQFNALLGHLLIVRAGMSEPESQQFEMGGKGDTTHVVAASTASRCNADILDLIFELSLPPYYFLDSSLKGGPESPWCLALRTKKAITSVCKTWRNAGIEFLYREVSFRRVHQVFAFLDILKSNTVRNLGGLVRRMEIVCYIPSKEGDRLFKEAVRQIMDRCPRMSTIRYAPVVELPTEIQFQLPLDNVFSITRIECQGVENVMLIVPQLSRFTNLQSLFINLDSMDPGMSSLGGNKLELPNLRTLHIADAAQDCPLSSTVVENWTMPNLHELTMLGSNTSTYFDTLETFCEKFGAKLTFLHFGGQKPLCDPSEVNHAPSGAQLLEHCPLLDHLVVSPGFLPDTIHHPNLKYCDLWSSVFTRKGSSKVGVPDLPLDKVKGAFPNLESIRVLDISFFDALDSSLPSLIWPEDETDFELKFPGLDIRKSDMFLLSCDLLALHREIANNLDDKEYSPDADGSESDGSSESSGSDEELGTW